MKGKFGAGTGEGLPWCTVVGASRPSVDKPLQHMCPKVKQTIKAVEARLLEPLNWHLTPN